MDEFFNKAVKIYEDGTVFEGEPPFHSEEDPDLIHEGSEGWFIWQHYYGEDKGPYKSKEHALMDYIRITLERTVNIERHIRRSIKL